MIPNYSRHVLPTNIGGKNAFHCILRGSRVDAVDCSSCSTPCDYAGHRREEWCVLYTPAFCRKCTVKCSMAVLEEFNNEA